MYKPGDAVLLQKSFELLVKTALEEVLKTAVHSRVLSSSIQHTDLQPEGHLFDIHLRVEVHPRVKKQPTSA